jgi:hypothetical protein
MFAAMVRIRVAWAVRMGLFLGLTLSWSACQINHPLEEEFSRAVKARQPADPHVPYSADGGAVDRFIQKHGREALPLYRKIIEKERHAEDYGFKELELVAAIEGFAALAGESSIPVLRELALDARVSNAAVNAALEQLARISQDEAIRVVGELLLVEEDSRRRHYFIFFISKIRNPNSIPFLSRALDQERDKSVRSELELAIRLLQKPNVCQLTYKAFGKDSRNRNNWQCNYRCPGPQPAFSRSSPVECQETEPLPETDP